MRIKNLIINWQVNVFDLKYQKCNSVCTDRNNFFARHPIQASLKMTWKQSGQEGKLQTLCFEWYGLVNILWVVVHDMLGSERNYNDDVYLLICL